MVILELMIINSWMRSLVPFVNRVKNKLRTRLLKDTANILLKIGEGGASMEDFDPNRVIDVWVHVDVSNMKELALWNVQLLSVFFLV